MPKLDLSALAKKYGIGPGEATGRNYRQLMKVVTAHETENVARGIATRSDKAYKAQLENLGEQYRDIIRFPDFRDVIPKKSIYLRKAAQDGDIIADTLRDRLTQKIRDALSEKSKTGRLLFVGTDGRVSQSAVKRLRAEMSGVYKWYTGRRGKKGQLPSNLDAIATTEIRSAADAAKEKYNRLFLENNAGIGTMRKKWMQNRSLSHEPRPAHTYMHGRVVKMDEQFNVPIMVKRKGRWVRRGWEKMDHPHAAGASPESVINCFPGDEIVGTDGIEKVYRRFYRGKILTIRTKKGQKFRVTPNHPILTDQGWIMAQFLEIGSNIISMTNIDKIRGRNSYINDRPSMLSEIYDFLSVKNLHRIRSGNLDFHGDGKTGNIDIISVNRKLRNALQSFIYKKIHKSGFTNSYPRFSFLKRFSHFISLGIRHLFTTQSSMSFLSNLKSLLFCHFGSTFSHKLGSSIAFPSLISIRRQSFFLFSRQTRHAKDASFFKRTNFHSAFNKSPFNSKRINSGDIAKIQHGFPGIVERDQIVNIERGAWSGHVYNLQTKTGYYKLYHSDKKNAIIVHNCHCSADYEFTLKKIKPKKRLETIEPKIPLESIRPKIINLAKQLYPILENIRSSIAPQKVKYSNVDKSGTNQIKQ